MASAAEQTTRTGPQRASYREATREALLVAAEHEFAVHGFGGASLRRIAERAGLKHGNVRHIFGTKHELLIEMNRAVFGPLADERLAALDELLAAHPRPTVEQIFDTSAAAVVRFMCHPRGALRGMLAIRGIVEHDVFWPAVSEQVTRLMARYVEALKLALPDVPEDELSFRWFAASKLFLDFMAPSASNVESPQPRTEAEIARLRGVALTILLNPLGDREDLFRPPPGAT